MAHLNSTCIGTPVHTVPPNRCPASRNFNDGASIMSRLSSSTESCARSSNPQSFSGPPGSLWSLHFQFTSLSYVPRLCNGIHRHVNTSDQKYSICWIMGKTSKLQKIDTTTCPPHLIQHIMPSDGPLVLANTISIGLSIDTVVIRFRRPD